MRSLESYLAIVAGFGFGGFVPGRRNLSGKAGRYRPGLRPPSGNTVYMHNERGECIHVKPAEVAEWKAGGFRVYAQPKHQPAKSRKRRKAQAIREGKKVSYRPLRPYNPGNPNRWSPDPRGSVESRLYRAIVRASWKAVPE